MHTTYKEMNLPKVAACLLALVTFGCAPSTLDQGLNESQALRNCYAAIKDKKISSIEDCSAYARFHAPLYAEIDQNNPSLAACEFSKHTLSYAKKYYPRASTLINKLKGQVETDCQHLKKGDL